jgi:hypothetical protein
METMGGTLGRRQKYAEWKMIPKNQKVNFAVTRCVGLELDPQETLAARRALSAASARIYGDQQSAEAAAQSFIRSPRTDILRPPLSAHSKLLPLLRKFPLLDAPQSSQLALLLGPAAIHPLDQSLVACIAVSSETFLSSSLSCQRRFCLSRRPFSKHPSFLNSP